ncbi:RtcB family protein [Desulfopila sp. IMCC35008]|uniref:RtcB family protein n=1 Tax=Desulfopila sp. IMCC35008 TaxID=2653858 RepID=UPI0013D0F285|nr:RtcB family protein [Desulfopila sp. IMCC35008]
MERTITTETRPIKLWLPDIDDDTLQQARNLANFPGIHHHIAIMPDAHVGYGMPIGGVAATDNLVIPNAVGVDIGCGVCTVQTTLKNVDRSELKKIMGAIRREIPLGFKHHKNAQPSKFMPQPPKGITLRDLPVVSSEYKSGRSQLGTLGGGNHFIEIQRDEDEYIWLMIHSGSRNIGYRVARHYNNLAQAYNTNHMSGVPTSWQLAFLPLDSEAGQLYLQEMQYCVDFARANRKLMMERLQDIIQEFCSPVHFFERIDIAHNYATLEHHFGKDVLVHRKGATRAGKGEIGIIPGSQGTSSYIVQGKGNPDSFCSCSHGAGRKLGRKQAQRTLNLQKEITILEEQHIIHAVRSKRNLEEAVGAYKNIEKVLSRQKDLVAPLTRLQPLAVVKG